MEDLYPLDPRRIQDDDEYTRAKDLLPSDDSPGAVAAIAFVFAVGFLAWAVAFASLGVAVWAFKFMYRQF